MTDRDLIHFLWDHGHFWNPACPDANNVTAANLDRLTLSDQAVQQAVRSFQQADANLELLAGIHHRRALVPDGLVGPATRQMAQAPRCALPDHPPPPGVQFKYADPGLQRAVESFQRWAQATATGSGSWPVPGCDPQQRQTHSIRVSINAAAAPPRVNGYLAEALAVVRAAYADIGLGVRYLPGGPAEIVKTFEPLGGSVIGWNELPRPGTCQQQLNGRLASDWSPELALWACLEAHETGHGVGLRHTNGGIMNPTILRVWPLTWRGSPSFDTLKAYFGGEPIGQPPPTTTTPPPPSDQDTRWLTNLYLDLLGRRPAPAEVQAWLPYLRDRPDAARRIVHSGEHNQRLVTQVYRTFLRRDPDAGGLRAFTDLLNQGVPYHQVIATIVASPEYYNRPVPA